MVMQLPERDEVSQTREQLHAQMAIAMGGRVAEEIIFGDDKVTTGAASDIEQATKRARKVLTDKIDDLHKLAKALLIYETLTGAEIEDLINKNIYPKNKEDLKEENDDQSSALGSMGLKPKIVH